MLGEDARRNPLDLKKVWPLSVGREKKEDAGSEVELKTDAGGRRGLADPDDVKLATDKDPPPSNDGDEKPPAFGHPMLAEFDLDPTYTNVCTPSPAQLAALCASLPMLWAAHLFSCVGACCHWSLPR